MSDSWSIPYTGEFRQLFPDEWEWEKISTIFREAFHGMASIYTNRPPEDLRQADSLGQMLRRLDKDIQARLQRPWERHKDALQRVLTHIDQARDLCKFIRQTEYVPPQQKKLMGFDINAATEAQKYWLMKHGVRNIPKNKNDASRMIGEMKKKLSYA